MQDLEVGVVEGWGEEGVDGGTGVKVGEEGLVEDLVVEFARENGEVGLEGDYVYRWTWDGSWCALVEGVVIDRVAGHVLVDRWRGVIEGIGESVFVD